VDLEAVKAASAPELVRCAVGAAVNAQGLLDDAELLSAAGRRARGYALAALAVEEAGKAAALSTLAVMPLSLRAQAPVGRMLEWHQLKLVGGMIITAVPVGTFAVQLAAMPASQVAGIVEDAQVLAQDVDRLKQRGLYADIVPSGQIRLPSEVTEADVAAQLGRARLAVSSASVLLVPGTASRITNPPAEAIELCRALVSAFAESGSGRTPEAAADVLLNTARKLREQKPASDARPSSRRKRRRT
jgi:AbiV family abortive infection protein